MIQKKLLLSKYYLYKKKFNICYISKESLKKQNIYYYFKYHRTTKNSTQKYYV